MHFEISDSFEVIKPRWNFLCFRTSYLSSFCCVKLGAFTVLHASFISFCCNKYVPVSLFSSGVACHFFVVLNPLKFTSIESRLWIKKDWLTVNVCLLAPTESPTLFVFPKLESVFSSKPLSEKLSKICWRLLSPSLLGPKLKFRVFLKLGQPQFHANKTMPCTIFYL